MFYYSIGYNSYEDSESIKLCHEKKFDNNEFEKIVISCTDIVADRLKEDLQKGYDEKQYDLYYDFKKILVVHFASIYQIFADVLCEKYGFKIVKDTCSFYLFGWPNMMIENDWDEEKNDKRYHKVAQIIRDKLKNVEVHPDYLNNNFEDEYS